MGIISSIFGERPSAPQTGGFTVGAEIPKELAPYYKDILGKSQALYNDSVSQGYQPYTGPSLAEFTPEQQQAFTGIAGLQGQQAPIYQEAMGMTRDSAAPITTEQIEEYMNPYQQAVVDVEKREATKQYQSQVQPQLAAQAARIQPFGGSRQAILEGMAADTQQRLLGDIQAKGSAQAYQDSVNLLNQQRMQQGQAAGQLATMGSNQFKSQLGELGALQTIGEEKQQLSQQALNEAYGQYIKEQEYPYQQLGRYQSVVTGAPIQGTTYVPPTPPSPSVGTQLLSGLGTLGATYGAFGGFSPGGFMGANKTASTGGGIGDLPVIKRQVNGSIMNMYAIDPPADPKSLVRRENESVEQFGRRVRVARGEIPALARDVADAERISNNDSFMGKIRNVFARQKLKAEARKEPTYIGPDGNIIYKGQRAFATPAGLSSIIQPDSKLDDISITSNPSTDAAIDRINNVVPYNERPEEIIDTNKKPEQDSETDLTSENKSVEELQADAIRLAKEQQEKKDQKDPDKTDKPDIYADATAAEDAYLLALGNRETRIQGDIDKLGVQEREAQFGNLAMMFARLGTKSGPLLSALVESTGEILPAALKTKNEFAKEGRRLKVAIEDAQLGELKTTADIKKSRAGLKSKTAQQALENEIEKKKVEILEKEAETKRLKVENPKLKDYKPYNKSSLDGIGEEVNSFLFKGDVEDIKANSPELYSILKSRKFNAGDKLADTEIDNFVKKLSNDPFARQQIYKNVELAGRIAAANTDQSFDQATATRKAIVDFLSTREALNIYNSGVVTDRLSF